MIIATISGGIMSFYSAYLTIHKYGKECVQLYFNDTKWEHPDLYRFLKDIEAYLGLPIHHDDDDGRTPADIFFYSHVLGNNRIPVCSHLLKAKRLQAYYKDGDTIVFGIGTDEAHRREKIINAYAKHPGKSKRHVTCEFPLLDNDITQEQVEIWFTSTGIKKPLLYELGMKHNNCSGGCVRQGKKAWRHLLKTLPEVYAEREELEDRFRDTFQKDVSFLKGITLKQLRKDVEEGR